VVLVTGTFMTINFGASRDAWRWQQNNPDGYGCAK
jgi:hypothetical protein